MKATLDKWGNREVVIPMPHYRQDGAPGKMHLVTGGETQGDLITIFIGLQAFVIKTSDLIGAAEAFKNNIFDII